MKNKDEDQDWMDALAGKPSPDADPEITRRATLLRQTIQRHNTTFEPSEFDTETSLQKLKFRVRREGLSGDVQRPNMSKNLFQFAMAASIVLVVGLMMRNFLPQESPQTEAEIMRSMGDRQIVLVAEPEIRLKQLTTELDQLGIKYQVERKEAKIILKIQGVDPAKDDVASFLERNHITPPVGMDVLLDIRPLVKP
jgi:hypothetical protein